MFGFYRLAAAVPRVEVADVAFNRDEILRLYRLAAEQGAAAAVFPELTLTGYSAGDLFFQRRLQRAALDGVAELAAATRDGEALLVVGAPLAVRDKLFNTAFVLGGGRILGAVPKQLMPNYREFYEKRQFCSGRGVTGESVELAGNAVPFGTDLIFTDGEGFRFGVEICEDLWGVLPPSSYLALGGALAVFNPSAGTELASKAAYRRDLVKQQSARILGAYVLASAGVTESTTDVVFGGHAMIAENGRLAAESERFQRRGEVIYADVDLERLTAARLSESSFNDNPLPEGMRFRIVPLPETVRQSPDFQYAWNPPRPLVPPDAERVERCSEIFHIQSAGLAKRMTHTRARTMVIGVSGGLDSTLAVLVAAECARLLDLPMETIRAFTMPGFGTTAQTKGNGVRLCAALGIALTAVDITPAALRHFGDIGHDPKVLDTTYENVQARERTQILMDVANKTGGLVIGTGDLSEIALGWSTYNGDHMSMYAVNCSIPKTLIRYMLETVAEEKGGALAKVLRDIIATPVSPELLPPDASGKIEQKTEEILGPYELHDFFLYHFLKYQAEPEKIRALALAAWQGVYSEVQIDRTLEIFIRRFFQQQFKRSCMPDGPKVGTIALSPRGDWRMPSDASAALWQN